MRLMEQGAKQEKAKRLRRQGRTYAAIALEMGVSTTTIQRWCKPDFAERVRLASREAKRRRKAELAAYDKAYAAARRRECVDCGQRRVCSTAKGNVCGSCLTARKEARWRRIQCMWAEGLSLAEIGSALGISVSHVGVEIRRMRIAGWDLPYRHPRVTA